MIFIKEFIAVCIIPNIETICIKILGENEEKAYEKFNKYLIKDKKVPSWRIDENMIQIINITDLDCI